MGEWQPIETAPKDGSDILLFCPDYKETLIACYRDTLMSDAKGKSVT